MKTSEMLKKIIKTFLVVLCISFLVVTFSAPPASFAMSDGDDRVIERVLRSEAPLNTGKSTIIGPEVPLIPPHEEALAGDYAAAFNLSFACIGIFSLVAGVFALRRLHNDKEYMV